MRQKDIPIVTYKKYTLHLNKYKLVSYTSKTNENKKYIVLLKIVHKI